MRDTQAPTGKAGEWVRAARQALQAGDESKMVRFSLLAAYGQIPAGLERATPLRAAQHLAGTGHHRLAEPLFEYAGDPRGAARSAAAAGDDAGAARHLERAGDWIEAAHRFQRIGRLSDAIRTLDRGERALARSEDEDETRPQPQLLEELRLLRAELLLEVGNTTSAAQVLRSLPVSVRRAELLERAGLSQEAVRGYLEAGATKLAHRAAGRSEAPERLLAQMQLAGGRPLQAAHMFAKLGLAAEAAEAYEAAGEWGYAAYRWEAAGKPQRAAQAYERAGQPAHAGRCFAAAGMIDAAVEAFSRGRDPMAAAELLVRSGQLLAAAAHLLAAGDRGRAASILMRLQPSEPSYAAGMLLLAPLLVDEGFAADALDRLRDIRVVPADVDADELARERAYWEARALEALQRADEAAERYRRLADHRDARERLDRLRPPAVAVQTPGTPWLLPPPQTPTGTYLVAEPVTLELLEVGGRVAGRYEILAEIGRGGMGRVFKALDTELGETVAIKGLATAADGGSGDEGRLLKELQICRRISHPNVVRVFDLGRYAGGIFITMEYLEGRALEQIILAESPLPFERIRDVTAQVAAGLWEAHGQGIVHRDLKPANVLVTERRVKILDFGIAAMAGAELRMTQAGFVMGSPMYMSPDQLMGLPLDGRSDLYSLGLLLYCMITGREPYSGMEPYALLRRKLYDPPPDVRAHRPETPKPWVAMIAKLLAKKAENRYQSAEEVLALAPELPIA